MIYSKFIFLYGVRVRGPACDVFDSTQQLFVGHLLCSILAICYIAVSKGNKIPAFMELTIPDERRENQEMYE